MCLIIVALPVPLVEKLEELSQPSYCQRVMNESLRPRLLPCSLEMRLGFVTRIEARAN